MSLIFSRTLAPLAALSLAAALGGCDGNITINGDEGVPLAEFDTSGKAPDGISMLGPDSIIVTEGDTFSITTDGDKEAVDALRFTLEDGTLGVLRDNKAKGDIGIATVRVTMPAPSELDMLGSGKIEVPGMARKAEINIGGSGTIRVANLASESLNLAIVGPGSVQATGTVEQLDLEMTGSGSAKFAGVKVGRADVNVVGSGNSAFASDGSVSANIVGSGDVTVAGKAQCEANKVGSGKLICKAPQ